MTKQNIPFGDLKRHYAHIKADIDTAVHRTLDSGWYILGNELQQFEKEFAEYANAPFAVGVGSGTEAIHLALLAAGIQPGDQVLTVANTAVPTLSAISFAGAVPVFVEIDPDTYCMDVGKLEAALTPKTRAIVPVHLYGHPCDMPAIMDIAIKHNLKVIEDCAQAHGAMFNGQSVGTFGDFGAFSFYPSKNLGAFGDAGAVICQNEKDVESLIKLRNYGQSERYYHDSLGFNSRLDELQAAILSAKLKYMPEWTERRRQIANLFNENIRHNDVVTPVEASEAKHVYHLYVIRTPRRDELRQYLAEHGIGTQIHYPVPCHRQQAYEFLGVTEGALPVTERYAQQVLSLPNYPELTDDEILTICDVVNSFQ